MSDTSKASAERFHKAARRMKSVRDLAKGKMIQREVWKLASALDLIAWSLREQGMILNQIGDVLGVSGNRAAQRSCSAIHSFSRGHYKVVREKRSPHIERLKAAGAIFDGIINWTEELP